MGKAKRTNYKRENLQKVELVRQVKERETSNPGRDITLMKIEKRNPWPGKVPIIDFYVPVGSFFLLFIQSH